MATTHRRLYVRWMCQHDVQDVIDIEQETHRQCPDRAFRFEQIDEILRKRNCVGMAVELPDGRIAGYMIYELRRTAIRLRRFLVHPALRRQGVGLAMLAKLKSKLSPARRDCLVFVVNEQDLDLQLFLRSQGFLATSIARGECSHGEQAADGYRFEYGLDTADRVLASVLGGDCRTVQMTGA